MSNSESTLSSASATKGLFENREDWAARGYSPAGCDSIVASEPAVATGVWPIRRAIVRARFALINTRLEDASRAVSQLERLLRHSDRADLIDAVRLLEASILLLRENFVGARAALMKLGSFQRNTLAATLLRYVDWKLNERGEIVAPDPVDYLAFPAGGKVVCRIASLCVSAAIAFDRLQLTLSANLAAEALELARSRYGNHSPATSFPAIWLAQVAYEHGRLDEAEALLGPRLAAIRTSGLLDCVARASILLARISLHRGQHGLALAALQKTVALGRTRRWPRLISAAAAEYERVSTATRSAEGRALNRCLPKHHSAVELGVGDRHARARSELASTAAQMLQTSLARDPAGRPQIDVLSCTDATSYALVERSLQHALSTASSGSPEHGYALLISCLRVGATRGLCMIFVDAGRPFLGLLERLYYALPPNDANLSNLRPYIATLLRATAQPGNSTRRSPTTYRALSPRETEILEMIARGMSNKRIAESLGITPETVKSHTKSIFMKLTARTRAQAVARAEALGLLSSLTP
jgi:DNA-binding CsgD family transcriptional regulator